MYEDSLTQEKVDGAEQTGETMIKGVDLPRELVAMRLKMLPKKSDLHDLNNWRGIMLLDAVSILMSMIITSRLDKTMKEERMEQSGFTSCRRHI